VVKGDLWATIHELNNGDVTNIGFPPIDFDKLVIDKNELNTIDETEISIERGKEVFNRLGCFSCHSTNLSTEGMYGPPLQGIFGKGREVNDGSFTMVDADYIRESIIDPRAKVASGYIAEMPSFEGILTEGEISSIILYLKSL